MATEAIGGETPTLFLRKATGLVRGWSVRDSMIYAVLATNFVTLAIYEFAFAAPAFPKGQLITSVLISGVWVSFLVIAYAGLIVTIPRAGGDYVWQTRILGSGIGFVMAANGRSRMVRHAQRDLPGFDDHHRAGRHPGVDRDGGIRQDPEVVHLRRAGRVRRHRGAAARQLARELRQLIQPRDAQAFRP